MIRMGLTYHFEFKALATTTAQELETFLRVIEQEAKAMGFTPTLVLNAVFDTTERKQFARRLTSGLPVEDARLKGEVLLLGIAAEHCGMLRATRAKCTLPRKRPLSGWEARSQESQNILGVGRKSPLFN